MAYRYRAYPSHEVVLILNRQMYLAKQLYNQLLEKAQSHYKETTKTFSRYDMNKWITLLKREKPELSELHSQVLQNVSDRVFACSKCGMKLDRDINAAINILSTAGRAGSYASGDRSSVSEQFDARPVNEPGTIFDRKEAVAVIGSPHL